MIYLFTVTSKNHKALFEALFVLDVFYSYAAVMKKFIFANYILQRLP